MFPYEIHITVNTLRQSDFIDWCNFHSVKPIVIHPENTVNGPCAPQVMTSFVVRDDDLKGAVDCAMEQTRSLSENGFQPLRVKIETTVENPDIDKALYFESHTQLLMRDEQKDKLKNVCMKYGAHMSRNPFKKVDDGKFVQMVTVRSRSYSDFARKHDAMIAALQVFKFKVLKTVREAAVFDTNESLDDSWLK